MLCVFVVSHILVPRARALFFTRKKWGVTVVSLQTTTITKKTTNKKKQQCLEIWQPHALNTLPNYTSLAQRLRRCLQAIVVSVARKRPTKLGMRSGHLPYKVWGGRVFVEYWINSAFFQSEHFVLRWKSEKDFTKFDGNSLSRFQIVWTELLLLTNPMASNKSKWHLLEIRWHLTKCNGQLTKRDGVSPKFNGISPNLIPFHQNLIGLTEF